MFEQLNKKEQLLGIANPRETFGTIKNDGSTNFYVNGFQTILLTLGFIGMGLYILFYRTLYSQVDTTSRMCVLVLLVFSLLESNYLDSYMILLTIVPCADVYRKKRNYLYNMKFVN